MPTLPNISSIEKSISNSINLFEEFQTNLNGSFKEIEAMYSATQQFISNGKIDFNPKEQTYAYEPLKIHIFNKDLTLDLDFTKYLIDYVPLFVYVMKIVITLLFVILVIKLIGI